MGHAARCAKLAAVVIALSLIGCSEPRNKLPRAVTVNGSSIPVERMRAILGSAESTPEKAQQALDGLIDKELLAQKAIKAKLPDDPRINDAIHATRTDILAQAYAQRLLERGTKVSESEIKAFYAEHPDLFEQRRVYQLYEIAVSGDLAQVKAARDVATQASNITDVAMALRARRIPFTVGATSRGTEQIPEQLRAVLSRSVVGQISFVTVEGGASVLQVLQADSAPLTLDAAFPHIERFLKTQKATALVAEESKGLRALAEIEHEFVPELFDKTSSAR